jgi:peroxiredoxin
MTMRQQWGIVLGIVLLLAVALGAGVHFLGDELFPVAVGSQAPEFKAVTVDGAKRTKTLADYKGKVVLLNVWATWCEPCRVEMPSIEKLHREFGPKGLSVVAVSVDDPGAESRIVDFTKELGLSFEVLHDPDQAITRSYQITGYPETFVIARDGTIRKKVIAAADWSSDANRALVRELLGLANDSVATPLAGPAGRDAADSVVLDARAPARP